MRKIHVFLLLSTLVFMIGCLDDTGDVDNSVPFDEQLSIDSALIEDYLNANGITALRHESGIRYVINVAGDGEFPRLGDVIAVKYEAALLDGTNLAGDTIGSTLNLNGNIISAWQLMVPEINEGGEITIYSPSGYAFGPNGNGSIPSNAVVIYQIELLAKVDNVDDQLQVDTLIIDEYLRESNLGWEVDPSGIRFRTLTEGNGIAPELTDEVDVIYEGRFLNGTVFDSSTSGVQFPLENLIEAWRIMIPQMKEGGRLEMYVPSRYGYGPTGTTGIAPNTVLVFEVGLIAVN
ncbi:MAG: FKBP-type peptidyl-prolyl cis-trans isomerase [Bacteroidota bacterium]